MYIKIYLASCLIGHSIDNQSYNLNSHAYDVCAYKNYYTAIDDTLSKRGSSHVAIQECIIVIIRETNHCYSVAVDVIIRHLQNTVSFVITT